MTCLPFRIWFLHLSVVVDVGNQQLAPLFKALMSYTSLLNHYKEFYVFHSLILSLLKRLQHLFFYSQVTLPPFQFHLSVHLL